MCDFSGRLVAWMDGELAENEAAAVKTHVPTCAECHERLAAYQKASLGFAAHYGAVTEEATAAKVHRRLPRWVPVLAGVAAVAAVFLLAFMPRSAKPIPVVPQVASASTPVALGPVTKPLQKVQPVQRRHVAARRKAPSPNWAMAGPAVQIAIPVEAMFPPGAMPAGVNYIANVSLTDGSVQGIRLQP